MSTAKLQTAKCGECLMTHVDVVTLNPDGSCPCCDRNHVTPVTPESDATERIEKLLEKAWGALDDVATLKISRTVLTDKERALLLHAYKLIGVVSGRLEARQ
jgi:hypothetical protein